MSVYTFTGTDSYSETDVKAVMQNTYEDIIGFANRKMTSYKTAEKWIEELTYALNRKVVKYFEIQLKNSSGEMFKSHRYYVDSYGYLSTGSSSGGIDYYSLPLDTTVGLFISLLDNLNSSEIEEIRLARGWGTGTAMNGNELYDRNYVCNNLRFRRSEITK